MTPAYLRGSSFGFRFDRRGLRRMGGPSVLFAMSWYLFQSGFVSSRDLLASKAKNLRVSELCPRTGGGQYFLGRFSHAGQDVLQETIGKGNLCVHQSEERLHLSGYVGEGRHDTSLKVIHRFRVVTSLKFVLASRNQESLFGPEATLLRGGAHFCTELLTWERQIALDAVLSHVINPLFCVAHLWRKRRKTAPTYRTHCTEVVAQITNHAGASLYVPIPPEPSYNARSLSAFSSLLVPICPALPYSVRFCPKSVRLCPKRSVPVRSCRYRSAFAFQVCPLPAATCLLRRAPTKFICAGII